MNDLFENITPGSQVVAPKTLKTKPKNRLEYFDNGPNCKAPVTQYGLLWDIGQSSKRCNLNFGLIDIDWIADNCDAAGLTSGEQDHLVNVGTYYAQLDDKSNLVTFGKWNGMAGTGAHNLTKGMKGLYFGTAAIMQLGFGQAPKVHLYHHGEWTVLDQNWKGTPFSSNPAKLWQVMF